MFDQDTGKRLYVCEKKGELLFTEGSMYLLSHKYLTKLSEFSDVIFREVRPCFAIAFNVRERSFSPMDDIKIVGYSADCSPISLHESKGLIINLSVDKKKLPTACKGYILFVSPFEVLKIRKQFKLGVQNMNPNKSAILNDCGIKTS